MQPNQLTITTQGAANMRKMIDFLRQQWPEDRRFDFDKIRIPIDEQNKSCGTAGCIMGWMPEVFPEQVKPDGTWVTLIQFPQSSSIDAASAVFGLDYDMAYTLFFPNGQAELGMKNRNKRISKEQAADMLEEFLSLATIQD